MAFGGRTPWELARSITSEQFTWLCAYARVEPFGFDIDNFRTGVVASTIGNVHGKRVSPKDFYPVPSTPVEIDNQTQEEQMRILMMGAPVGKAN